MIKPHELMLPTSGYHATGHMPSKEMKQDKEKESSEVSDDFLDMRSGGEGGDHFKQTENSAILYYLKFHGETQEVNQKQWGHKLILNTDSELS